MVVLLGSRWSVISSRLVAVEFCECNFKKASVKL
jgi:hypothetical protein